MQDMDDLISGLHERGMKLIMDLVVNHTSDMHKWFKESRSSKTSEKRDWYIWKKPTYDSQGQKHPPNNWAGIFGGNSLQFSFLLLGKNQPSSVSLRECVEIR